MFLLIRKILKKSKTYVISNKEFVPEKSNVTVVTLKIVNDSTPSFYDSSLNEFKPNKLKRQCTSVKDLDKNLAKLRKTLSSTPTYHRYTFSTPPQLYQSETHEPEYSGHASSTVSEEDEEYMPVVKTRKANMIRRINSSKQRFSSPPIKEAPASIERCYSQNSNRFQFRLSQNLLPSIPMEEDALSFVEETTTPLPLPMQPILNCYH